MTTESLSLSQARTARAKLTRVPAGADLTYAEVVAFEKITQRNFERACDRAEMAEAEIGQMKLERAMLLRALHKAHDFLDSHGNGWEEADTLDIIREALDIEQVSA